MRSISGNTIRPPIFSICLISSLSLSYEVLLTRLLSIVQWHHFAYMIISIALLGYGASGAFISIFQTHLKPRFAQVFFINIVLFALTCLVGFLCIQFIPFNPLELFWIKSQWIWLSILYIVLMLPFFFAGNCVGLSLYQYSQRISTCYAFDLTGAAIGAIMVVFFLYWFTPVKTLQLIVALAGITAIFAVFELGLPKFYKFAGLLLITVPWLLPLSWLSLHPSEFKPLSQVLNTTGSRIIKEKSSVLGQLTVVESSSVPFHHAPGLSLNSKHLPGEQLGLFFDGDGMSAINKFDGNIESLQYMANTSTALAYELLTEPGVLILGSGGGSDILQAKYFRARHIDAVEINPQVIELINEEFGQYSGYVYSADNVSFHIADSRSFLQKSKSKYDLIQMTLTDSFASSASGLHALNESYLYTTEAIKLYFSHLQPGGYLSLTRWVKLPPRDTLKLLTTIKQALKHSGISNPEQHIALIRNWNTATLIVKKQALTKTEIEQIAHFSQQNSFDLAYFPEIDESVVNRYNILPQPYFFLAARDILSTNNSQFLHQYKYNLEPSTDDKPYFLNFIKWQHIPELIKLPANQGMAFIEWGNIILLATLLQALLASIFFILLPLWIHQRNSSPSKSSPLKSFNNYTFTYFTLLGIAFMFIEIAFIQRFILFLGHPTYSLAVVLTGFLLFAGLGSAYSKKLPAISSVKFAVISIIAFASVYLLVLPEIFSWGINHSDSVKIIITLLLLAPLAFFMGMPFPKGLSLLAQISPGNLPWAWGVNGCASVISAITATIVAMQLGFTWVIIFALICYTLAAVVFYRTQKTLA